MALSRRAFLARAATVGAAAPFLAWLESCGRSLPADVAADAPEALTLFAFTPAQRAALSAAMARLIPAQQPGDWSAADAYEHHPNTYAVQTQISEVLLEILAGMGATSAQPAFGVASSTAIPQFFPPTCRNAAPAARCRTRSPAPATTSTAACAWAAIRRRVWSTGRVHGIPNLYVADGSVLPTSGGYNPTLTIQAMAWRTAAGMLNDA